jgi:tetratricopeptide (TPR) repeat protein
MVNRANILRHLGRFADADEAVVLARSNAAELAADHPTMLGADLLTADLQIARGDVEGALPALDDLVARCRRVIGDRAVKTLEVRGIRAKALVAMERPADALRELDDAITAAGGDDTGRLSLLRVQRGELLAGNGRFAEAEADLLRAEAFFAANAPADPSRGDAVRAIVRLYETWPRPEAAERWRARIE